MDRKWVVEVEGIKHLIEVDYGVCLKDFDSGNAVIAQRDGKLVVDGNEIHMWKSAFPKEINFEIGGKPAVLRKKGFFATRLDLFFERQLIKPA